MQNLGNSKQINREMSFSIWGKEKHTNKQKMGKGLATLKAYLHSVFRFCYMQMRRLVIGIVAVVEGKHSPAVMQKKIPSSKLIFALAATVVVGFAPNANMYLLNLLKGFIARVLLYASKRFTGEVGRTE